MANNAVKDFADLSSQLQRLLSRYNIDAAKWDVARSAVSKAPNGREYLMPNLIEDTDVRQAIYLMYITEADV